MTTLIQTLDPQTYGFNRTPIALGVVTVVVVAILCSKLMSVLHAAGLPVVQ